MEHSFHTITSFNQLQLDAQGEEVFVHGDYFDTINGIVLYHYGDFIVECYYNPELNKIKTMQGISIVEAADKYIQIENVLL